jgi:hypothetical protein
VAEQRKAGLWQYALLVVLFGVSGIVWWTFAPTWLPETDPTVLLGGEMAFKLAVVLGGWTLVQRWRRRRRPSVGRDGNG